jgi:molybdopterin molybdotransferase
MSFLPYEESQDILNSLVVDSSKSENVPLSCSLGRVLAKDIVAKFNDPQFPTA